MKYKLLSTGFYLFFMISIFHKKEIQVHSTDFYYLKTVSDTTSDEDLTLLLKKLMEYHEKQIPGLHYNAPPPPIFRDSTLDFEGSNRDGTFSYEKRALAIPARYRLIDISALLARIDSPWMSLPREVAELRDVLSHELGHYYTSLLVDKTKGKSWLSKTFNHEINATDSLGIRTVVEGIAEYFGCFFGVRDLVAYFDTTSWNNFYYKGQTFDALPYDTVIRYVYGGGYKLTKPVIDLAGERGIQWFINNRLAIYSLDLSIIPLYRNRALKELSKLKKF